MSEVYFPNSTKLLGRKQDRLASNLGVAALKRYNPDTDLVSDQFAIGPDNKTLGKSKTVNYPYVYNLSASQTVNESLLKKSTAIFVRDEQAAGRNPIALPKTKSGFFKAI